YVALGGNYIVEPARGCIIFGDPESGSIVLIKTVLTLHRCIQLQAAQQMYISSVGLQAVRGALLGIDSPAFAASIRRIAAAGIDCTRRILTGIIGLLLIYAYNRVVPAITVDGVFGIQKACAAGGIGHVKNAVVI